MPRFSQTKLKWEYHPLGCWLQNFHATKVGQDWWTWFLTWCSCGARCGSTFANSLVPCSCAPGASYRSDPGSTQVSKFHSSAVCRSFLIALQSSKCGTCDIGSISCPSCSLAIFQMAIICSPFHMILSCTAKTLLASVPQCRSRSSCAALAVGMVTSHQCISMSAWHWFNCDKMEEKSRRLLSALTFAVACIFLYGIFLYGI